MHHIRRFCFNSLHELSGGEEAAAVHEARHAADQVVCLARKVIAGSMYMVFCRLRAAAIADHGLKTLRQQRMMDVPCDFAGTSMSIYAVYLKDLHNSPATLKISVFFHTVKQNLLESGCVLFLCMIFPRKFHGCFHIGYPCCFVGTQLLQHRF